MIAADLKEELLVEIASCFRAIKTAQTTAFASEILKAKRIFVQGKGRMGLILKSFAANLAETGFEVHVIGDVTVPAIGPEDLLIVTPTDGDPKSSTRFLQVARQNKARVIALSANRKGPVGSMADLIVDIRARTMRRDEPAKPSIQPMCSTLEQTGLLFFGAILAMVNNSAKYNATRAGKLVLEEMTRALHETDDSQFNELFLAIEKGRRVFVHADVKELLILSCFAMRLFHMGIAVFVLGEVTAPVPGPGDLLLSSCSDGYSPQTLLQIKLASEAGAEVITLTSLPETPALRQYSKSIISIPGWGNTFASRQADGAAYDQALLIALDYAVLLMMEKNGLGEADLLPRHTNLE